jgi:hypothetical protein
MDKTKYAAYLGILLIALILLAAVFVYFGTPPEERSDFFEPQGVCICINPDTNIAVNNCECQILQEGASFEVNIET